MRKGTIAVVLGSLLIVPATGAFAQDRMQAVVMPNMQIASPKAPYMVFFEKDSNRLSPAAMATVQNAAVAAKEARVVRVEATGANGAAVKDELVRQGVPAQAIKVSDHQGPASDRIADPMGRRVEIKF
jgi:IMP dehydrogenase/GMP reductase